MNVYVKKVVVLYEIVAIVIVRDCQVNCITTTIIVVVVVGLFYL